MSIVCNQTFYGYLISQQYLMQSDCISNFEACSQSKLQYHDKINQNITSSSCQRRVQQTEKRISMSTVDSESPSQIGSSNFMQNIQNKRDHIRNSIKSKRSSINTIPHPINEQKTEQQHTSQICLICQKSMLKQHKFSMGCAHFACESCIHSYIISKVKQKHFLICFNLSCNFQLRLKSKLFATLPGEIQQQYRATIHEIIQSKKIQQTIGKCNSDNSKFNYCQSMISNNKQEISQNQINFEKLRQFRFAHICVNKFKICKICKKTTKKMPLLNKLDCQCGYSYCYLCGRGWEKQGHICRFLLVFNNKFQDTLPTQRKVQSKKQKQKSRCVQSVKGWFLLLVWALIIILILLPKFIIKSVIFSIVSILAGITFYACAYVWAQNKVYKKILILVFYPLAMFVGIGMAFSNFFTTHLMQQLQWFRRGNQFFLEF